MLALILVADCASPIRKTPTSDATNVPLTLQATIQSPIVPYLLAEWTMGEVHDMAWSPDTKMFAVNYYLQGNNVQAFEVESLKSIWTAENSLSLDLTFTQNGQFITESNSFIGILYLRSVEQGNVVRQIKSENCARSGQTIIANPRNNTILTADTNELSGLNATNIVIISLWNLETSQCNDLIHYTGSFDLLDVNSSGNLLVYGGDGTDDSPVIWDIEKQAEVCRTKKVDFGHFVPGQNILAVSKAQKMIFIDASTCEELRELNLPPTLTPYFSFSQDGRWFAIAAGSIQIMETSTGKAIAQIPIPENFIPSYSRLFNGMVFSPDDRYLLLAFSTSTSDTISSKVQLWRLKP
jgi:hypothetical protein